MKTKIAYLLAGVIIATAVIEAIDLYKKRTKASGALSVEQAQTYMKQSFPNVEVDRVIPAGWKKIFAVIADGKVYYMSRNGTFLMAGTLYNLRDDVNLTEQIKASLRKENLANLKQEHILTYAPEEHRHVVRVFSDVDCPYCRKLHSQIDELHKYGIRVDYIVVPFFGEEAKRKAVGIWCSDDRIAAMDAGMSGAPIETLTCENPIDNNMQLARSLGVNATPAFLLEDGRLLVGYRPVQDLLYELKNSPASPKS